MSLLAPAALAAVSRRIGFAGTPAAAPPPAGYTALVDALSPVSHYPMGPSSGTALADRKGVVEGTLTAVEYWAETLALDDTGGRSLGFDGATSSAAIPHVAAHKPAAGGGIAFLVSPDRLSAARQVLVACDANGAAGGWSVELKYSRVRAYLRDGGNAVREVRAWWAYQDGTHPFRVGLGSTHHIALTWGPNGLRLYVDGVLEAYHATPAVAAGTSGMSVGAWHTGTFGFDGVINHLVVFRQQPSTAQVATLARARPVDHTPDFAVATVAPGQAGVAGNGTGDDGPAIRAILSGLLAAPGPKKLRITSGATYLVQPSGQGSNSYAGLVAVFELSGVQNLVIEGSDPAVKPILKLGAPPAKDEANLYHPMFRARNDCIGIEFRDIEIDGNRTAYFDGNATGVHDGAMFGILWDGTEVGCARRCFIHHCHADGIMVTRDAVNGAKRCREVRATGCTLTWGGRGGHGIEDITDLEIDNCLIRDNGRTIGTNQGQAPRYGMDFEPRDAAGVQQALIHHNEVRSNGARCIAIEGLDPRQNRFIKIYNNTLRESGVQSDIHDIFFAIRPDTDLISDVEIRENTIGQRVEMSWNSTGAGTVRRLTMVDNTFLNEYTNRQPNIVKTAQATLVDSTIRRNLTPGGVNISTTNLVNSSVQTGSETPEPETPPS